MVGAISKRCISLAAIVLACAAASAVVAGSDDKLSADGWALVSNEHAIAIYRRDVPGSHIVALKGEGTIDAPVWKVASVLLDTQRAPEWVDSLKESRVVKRLGDDEYIEFNHLHLPLILKDREFVSDVRIDVDARDHSVTLAYRPADGREVPNGHAVRGEILSGAFHARSLGAGRGTILSAELHCDPKGAIPAWVVNFFQKSWPRNTLEGIRRQVAKSDVVMPPAFASVLQPTLAF
jgi:START domain